MRVARIAMILFVSSAAFAMQDPAAPPIKMGLWEMTNTSTMTATGKMADAMAASGQLGKPNTQSMKVCFTPDTWKNALAHETRSGCTRSNVISTSKQYSLTMTCNVGTSTMTVNVNNIVDSSEAVHGTVHMVSNSPSGQMTSDGTGTGKFLGSDCGDVKPLGTIRR
jgi:Protein of unknown function (DUF3617)